METAPPKPHRSPEALAADGLVIHTAEPLNAEASGELLASHLTPWHSFYIRCHGSIPQLDGRKYQVAISGLVERPVSLDLEALRRRFPVRTITAVLQCAGNRRADLDAIRPVSGDKWSIGAIGNGQWTGIALADVLRESGVPSRSGLHVAFTGADEVEIEGDRFGFGTSIPLERAMSGEVLLAWALNGQALALEHGYPLRAIVPGYAGARSVKWLRGIEVRPTPSENYFQSSEYKLFPPEISAETADWRTAEPINDMPLNAVIAEPAAGASVPSGAITIRGYAVGGPHGLARVEVSTNGGATWSTAAAPAADPETRWAWTLWQLPAVLSPREHELIVRAWDRAGTCQPADPAQQWNFKGYACNAWHRVRVTAA